MALGSAQTYQCRAHHQRHQPQNHDDAERQALLAHALAHQPAPVRQLERVHGQASGHAPALKLAWRQRRQGTPAFGSLPGSEGGDFVFELPPETEFLNPQTAQLSNDAIALNSKLDAARPDDKPGPVPVKDLQGGEQKLVTPVAVPSSARQLAQRANDRGLQLFKEKQYAQAEAEFTEALKLRPDFALAANNLGFVFYKQGKFVEAARWFDNTIKMDPSRAVAYRNLGDAHAQAGEGAKAKAAYTTYLALAPASSGAAYVKQQLEKL